MRMIRFNVIDACIVFYSLTRGQVWITDVGNGQSIGSLSTMVAMAHNNTNCILRNQLKMARVLHCTGTIWAHSERGQTGMGVYRETVEGEGMTYWMVKG